MKLIDKILAKFRKKGPEKPPVQPIPGYSYWDYRRDLFDPKFTFEEIVGRAGGHLPQMPRYPKVGERWLWSSCLKHGHPQVTYPYFKVVEPADLDGMNLWPFLFCKCLSYFPMGGADEKRKTDS